MPAHDMKPEKVATENMEEESLQADERKQVGLFRSLWETKLWRFFPALLLFSIGAATLFPIMPTIISDGFASQAAGRKLRCQEFTVDTAPVACQDAHATAVVWSSWSSFISGAVLSFLCAPLVGSLSDQYGRKPFMEAGLVLVIFPMLVTLTHLLGWTPIQLYFPINALNGFCSPFTIMLTSVVDLMDPGYRAISLALFITMFSFGIVAGAGIGAVVSPVGAVATCIGLTVATLVYIILVLPETAPNVIARRQRDLTRSLGAAPSEEAPETQPLNPGPLSTETGTFEAHSKPRGTTSTTATAAAATSSTSSKLDVTAQHGVGAHPGPVDMGAANVLGKAPLAKPPGRPPRLAGHEVRSSFEKCSMPVQGSSFLFVNRLSIDLDGDKETKSLHSAFGLHQHQLSKSRKNSAELSQNKYTNPFKAVAPDHNGGAATLASPAHLPTRETSSATQPATAPHSSATASQQQLGVAASQNGTTDGAVGPPHADATTPPWPVPPQAWLREEDLQRDAEAEEQLPLMEGRDSGSQGSQDVRVVVQIGADSAKKAVGSGEEAARKEAEQKLDARLNAEDDLAKLPLYERAMASLVTGWRLILRSPWYKILALIWIIISVNITAFQDLLFQYLQLTLGFTTQDQAALLVTMAVCGTVLKLLFIALLVKRIGEQWLLVIALVAFGIEQFMFALAQSKAFVFLATAVGSLATMGAPAMLALQSSRVEAHLQGAMSGVMQGIGSLASGIGPLGFAYIFKATASSTSSWYFPQLVWYVGGVLTTVAVGLSCTLHWHSDEHVGAKAQEADTEMDALITRGGVKSDAEGGGEVGANKGGLEKV